jgi:hypothetical protein
MPVLNDQNEDRLKLLRLTLQSQSGVYCSLKNAIELLQILEERDKTIESLLERVTTLEEGIRPL